MLLIFKFIPTGQWGLRVVLSDWVVAGQISTGLLNNSGRRTETEEMFRRCSGDVGVCRGRRSKDIANQGSGIKISSTEKRIQMLDLHNNYIDTETFLLQVCIYLLWYMMGSKCSEHLLNISCTSPASSSEISDPSWPSDSSLSSDSSPASSSEMKM